VSQLASSLSLSLTVFSEPVPSQCVVERPCVRDFETRRCRYDQLVGLFAKCDQVEEGQLE
jgi:hypothetical protein